MSKLLEKVIHELKMLPEAEQEKMARSIMNILNSEEYSQASSHNNQTKLSEVLALPELEEKEEEKIFKRDKDTGREINL